jgi:hypothetical protein
MASATLALAGAALSQNLRGIEGRTDSFERVCRIAVLVGAQTEDLAGRTEAAARPDGGWADVSETIWCLAFLKQAGRHDALAPGLRWLSGQRLEGGGWGRSARDVARIPMTALVLRFLAAEIGTEADWCSVERLWNEDLASAVQLTYKGGFFLLCQTGNPKPSAELARRTIEYMEASQHEDGGFGPWRNHPIGSDPWTTGICVAGLCSHPDLVSRQVIGRAVGWLCRTQLSSGLWPCHFIDEGSAYAYWGLREAIHVLEAR